MKLTDHGVFLCGGVPQPTAPFTPDEGRRRTMAYRILQAHNQSGASGSTPCFHTISPMSASSSRRGPPA